MRTAILALTAGLVVAPAQRSVQFDVTYSCSNGASRLKVLSCAGPAGADACDIQYLDSRSPQGLGARISATRKQVTGMVRTCVIERPRPKPENPPAPAQPSQPRAAAQRPAQPPPGPPPQVPQGAPSQPRSVMTPPVPPTGAGGFKVGDTVSALTGFGWVNGKVLSIRGASYYIQLQNGVSVWKDYPSEVHRVGAPNAEDHARGVYELQDRVQVLVDGEWTGGEVVTILNGDYQVRIPGNRLAWANPQQLRYIGPQVKPAVPKPGTPPRPGLVSCAGKIEGRYSQGGFGAFTIVFRGAKASVEMYGDGQEAECWMGGGKIYLRVPGSDLSDMTLNINNDGTLDSPAGELKKKGN